MASSLLRRKPVAAFCASIAARRTANSEGYNLEQSSIFELCNGDNMQADAQIDRVQISECSLFVSVTVVERETMRYCNLLL